MLKRAFVLFFTFFIAGFALGQNVSNKGKLFWVGHMGHIDGTGSNFALYITTDASSNAAVRVSIPGGTYSQIFIVPSNQVTVVTLPSSQTYMNCTDCILDRGVKIESLNHDIVVYAHIYSNARSDATLLIPYETLGKEYYAIAFTQSPSGSSRRSEFMLVGVEDSTFVDIYPTVDILPNKSKGTKYTVMLNTGEVYHAQSSTDVTGTRIVARSANGISCKKVAAFSGSSFTRVGCSFASTGDNLYQQLFPTTSWGMEFVTAPLKSRSGDQFRVLAKYDSTKVIINGGTPVYLDEGEHHSFVEYNANYITCDKPVTLAQYPRTQNCDGNTGDPTMIVIPPIEQMVKYVAMYSSPYQNITGQYLNIIMRTADTSSFRLDGQKVVFSAMANNTKFAYAQQTVNSGNHLMNADSFFQVVAYGFGTVEAYGYAGGTNIKNLVQSISASRDSMCLGDTLALKAVVNYIPTSMKWYFGDGSTDTSNYYPKKVYALPGEYVISLVTRKEGLVDCGSTDSTVYRVRVHGYPTASFSIDGNCLKDTFKFLDLSTSNTSSSYVSKWNWIFGDSTTSTKQSLSKYFSRIDTFSTRLIVWNNNLCSDTVYGLHMVSPHPEPALSKHDTCPGTPFLFTDQSSIIRPNTLTATWLIDSSTTQVGVQISYSTLVEGMHYIDLLVESDSGCSSASRDSFLVYPKPTAKFSQSNHCFGEVFLVTDSSKLATFWQWDYSDTSFVGSPANFIFKDTGIYPLALHVRSVDGCTDSFFSSVTVYPNPLAEWKSEGNCASDRFVFEPEYDTTLNPSWTYAWTIAGQSYSGPGQSIQFATFGMKQASLKVESVEQCIAVFSGQVYVNPNPIAQGVYEPNCLGEFGLISDQSVYAGSSTFTRLWTWGGNQFVDSVQFISPNSGLPTSVTLRIETDSACADSGSVNLSWWDLPQADFSIVGECPLAKVDHQDLSTAVSGDPISNYEWSLSSGLQGSGNSFSWVPANGGDYQLEQIVISSKGCRDTALKPIHILDIPTYSVEAFPSCVEFLAELEDKSSSSEHNINGWDWIWDGKAYSGKRVGEVFIDPGYYVFTLSLTTDAGCAFPDVLTDSIFISPKPTASFTGSPAFALMDNPNFVFTNNSVGGSIFKWQFGDGFISTQNSPTHTYADTGLWWVKLRVENSYGCTDSTMDTVRTRPMLECFIPNAVTPNGDRMNDFFGPICDGLAGFEMYIYNRWGQEVFHTKEGEFWYPFEGEARELPEGVYMYVMVMRDYLGNPQFRRGNVVVLR